MQRWWEIAVTTQPELAEDILWRMAELGCQQTASVGSDAKVTITAYLPIERSHLLDLAAFKLLLAQDAQQLGTATPHCQVRILQEEDWSNSWKQHWQPQAIGDELIIYPAWITPPATELKKIIYLDPGSAFGTGTHPTTQLCLEAIEMRLARVKPEQHFRFADIGCGSGILTIAALLFGAKQAYAVDTDILAVKATQHNAHLNHIESDRLWVGEGDINTLLTALSEPVDGFACNILLEPVLAMIPSFAQLVKPQGWGIISGVLIEQVPDLMEALNQHKWQTATLWKRKGWCCLTIKR